MPRFVGTVLVAVILTACSGTTDPSGGILRFDGSASIKSESPIVVAGVVTVRNISNSIVSIEQNACPYVLNLHNYASSSSDPIWNSEPMICLGYTAAVDLAPGNAYAFEVKAIIASELNNGLYYLTVVNEHWKNGDTIIIGNIEIANGKVKR